MADRQSSGSAMARADSAHQKIEAHEDLCAERYKSINDTLSEVKGEQKNHGRVGLGILLALLGFMGVQLWEGRNNEPERPRAAAPAP